MKVTEGNQTWKLPRLEQIRAVLGFQKALEKPGARHSRSHRAPGVFPYSTLNKTAQEFYSALYKNGFVLGDFDWMSWAKEAHRYSSNPELIKRARLLTICRLLTFHSRKDRFCGGHFGKVLSNGEISGILERLSVLEKALVAAGGGREI